MANDFGTTKSVLVLTIVAGCFAILWPNVFSPMVNNDYIRAQNEGKSNGCCDVIFDNDMNGIKVMTELCEKILYQDHGENKSLASFSQGKLELCKQTVLEKCNLNITELLTRTDALGKDYKQTLDLLRTLNSSICLRESFGISIGQIGLPRRMKVWGLNISKHMKPERPPHLHPDLLHPALREKGRAIQQSKKPASEVRIEAGSPLSGMRPTLGGAGHVVPPPKGGTTMGIVMPMYTIGIVIFFMYTLLKLLFKKSGESQQCEDLSSDVDFQHDVFTLNHDFKEKPSDSTKLGDMELEMLKERLQETEKAMERIVAKMMSLPKRSPSKDGQEEVSQDNLKSEEDSIKDAACSEQSVGEPSKLDDEAGEQKDTVELPAQVEQDESQAKAGVKVVGMEMTESCQGGKWSRIESSATRTPHNIYIPTVLPDQSTIMVTDSSTETLTSSLDDAPVVLSGKVTLSLIGIHDSGIAEEIHSCHEVTVKETSEKLSVVEPVIHTVQDKDESKLLKSEDKDVAING